MIDQAIFDVMRAMPVFKPEMRKANRDGLKSQTRRVIDPQPDKKLEHLVGAWFTYYWINGGMWNDAGKIAKCPYGQTGNYCYMREPMARNGAYAWYKDDNQPVISNLTGEMLKWRWKKDVLTSIFMPKEAARFVYRYKSIRVEQVQDITEEDAKAEGIVEDKPGWFKVELPEDHAASSISSNSARGTYQVLFDHINIKRGYGWDANPWVWVLNYVEVQHAKN